MEQQIEAIPYQDARSAGALAPSLLFGATILLSAFLLFQVQPLIAKLILPWFGGSAAVWTSCMLFFQVALLAGYGYAHWLTGQPRGRQPIIHVCLLAVSLLSLPILPSARWKPTGSEDPLLGILGLLAVTAGLPYFLLSSTSPLLQSWYSRARGGAMPWRFFALSNAGSMVGLLSYPIVVEPFLTNHMQAWTWSLYYGAFAILCTAAAFGSRDSKFESRAEERTGGESPRISERLLWIGLAACASALLLAVTNYITQNVAAVPFLWVAPLSLYLLSFILCFDSDRWYYRPLFAVLAAAALIVFIYSGSGGLVVWGVRGSVSLLCGATFVLFMVCHGELARRRPAPKYLTSFYLMISTGGAIGGLLIGFVAPYLFNALYDLPMVLSAIAILFAVLVWLECRRCEEESVQGIFRAPFDWMTFCILLLVLASWILLRIASAASAMGGSFFLPRNDPFIVGAGTVILLYVLVRTSRSRKATALICGLSATLACAIVGVFGNAAYASVGNARALARNFYGALMVYDRATYGVMGDARNLAHGTIKHGEQFLRPENRKYPTTYYARNSGIGLTLKALMKQGPVNAGLIGLGAGTIAAYARPIDRYRFYEINPLVVTISQTWFSFLRDCPAPHNVVLGDARLSLDREPPQQFDVLAVDAFSGDAIPVHLLTREAFSLYWRHLKPDGVLAVHVSNRYLTLAPIVMMAALESNKEARFVIYGGDVAKEEVGSDWVLVSSRSGFFDVPEINRAGQIVDPIPGLKMWSDDYSNLYKILK